jgi:hypothetical protein
VESYAKVCSDIPKITASSISPAVRRSGSVTWVSYLLATEETAYAILRFDGVESFSFGYPNDEGLDDHPLFGRGLEPYELHEVAGGKGGKRYFIATFHDGTLEMIAQGYSVEAKRIEADDARTALKQALGPGPSEVL